MVAREGAVKVLDFGLAKLVADDADDSGETLSTSSGSSGLRPWVASWIHSPCLHRASRAGC
jgi:hypothetical protein